MLSLHALSMLLTIVSVTAGLAASEQTESQNNAFIVGREQAKTVRASLIGEWTGQIGVLRLGDDGTFEIGDRSGQYHVEGRTLTLTSDSNEVRYEFSLSGRELTLSGGDIAEPVKFTKLVRISPLQDWRSSLSWSSLKTKGRRIAVILLIVVVCQIIVRLLGVLSRLTIYSNWGPLRFVYQRHKKRTQTLHSLALNISRYIIYILAIGFVLTELGVNYTMYFASLSVVGLAIGFGSQGLVQDMVTGFFIVFEEQFNVGDMVEIPPHTGIVEELGLRMTRLRNYLGQRVTIPNRNIAVVGNYTRGAQQVYLDVAIAAKAEVDKTTAALVQVARETADQFQDIILATPKSLGEISLATGQRFCRLHLAIWPQQQWVIDQELVPRIRATIKSQGLDVPDDKVVVFYHPREKRSIASRRSENARSLP